MGRTFGRQYVIRWDTEVGRYHVTLGGDSVGFHKTEDGAKSIVALHARQVTMPSACRSFSIVIEPSATGRTNARAGAE